MSSAKQIIVSGGFDDIKSRDLRFLKKPPSSANFPCCSGRTRRCKSSPASAEIFAGRTEVFSKRRPLCQPRD
jgi:hypothetical protein